MKKFVTLVTFCIVLCTASSSTASAQAAVLPTYDVQSIFSGEPQPHPQTIYVKTRVNGTTVLIPVLVFFTDLVLWVKQDVADVLGISIDSFVLVYGNTVLDEDLPLNAYGITTKSILSVRYL